MKTYFEAAYKNSYPTQYALQKQLNNTLVLQPEYAWLRELNSMVRGEAVKDFYEAAKRYTQARMKAKRNPKPMPEVENKYKPTYKRKKDCNDSCRLFSKSGTEFKAVSAHELSIVRIRGFKPLKFKTRESVSFLEDADIRTCTFSRKGDKYYICLTYEKTNRVPKQCGTGKIGLDLGIHHAFVGYDGTNTIINDIPQNLFIAENHTKKCLVRLAKTRPGSNRHKKELIRVERAYMHENEIKRDWREKITIHLVRNYSEIVMDEYNFATRKKAHGFNHAAHRVGTYAFRLRLQEKCAEYGVDLKSIPRFTPTTKTCSCCGNQKNMTLKDRVYECNSCGFILDRDENSARNTFQYTFV